METGWIPDVNTPAALREGPAGRAADGTATARRQPVRERSASLCDAVEFRERVWRQFHFGGREIFPQVRHR